MNSFKLILVLLGLVFAGETNAQPKHLFKIATLVPEGSSWTNALRAIDEELRRETSGAVGFKIYPGGVQGEEKVVLRKIRIRQLQGGGFGGQATSLVFPDILALEMPFLFDDYKEIDYVLDQMDDFYHTGYEERGYVLLGWVDVGFVHILSQKPVRTVEDIRSRKVWRLADEPITEVLFRLAGVTSIPLSIPDVLLGLQTNLVDVVYAPPAVAIVLQWFTRVQYVTKLPINFTLGALLVDKRAFYKLPAEEQALLRRIAHKHMVELTKLTRSENAEALEVMQANGLKLVEASTDDVQTFRDLVTQSEAELTGKAFSTEARDLVQQHLSAYRQAESP